MALSKKEFTRYIREFKFRELFNDMGWNNDKTSQPITVDNLVFNLNGIAEKSGFKILLCQPNAAGLIPEYTIRRKIEAKITKLFQEHLIILVDAKSQEQIWQLVVRKTGRPAKATETRYHITQDPELLFQRASGIFFELDEEENITIVDVTQRVTENFHQNNEKVTKQFYDKFSKEHSSFLKFIKGIEENVNKDWYASLMLNRLMFCYFIQKKGFLDKNKNYLRDKLRASQEKKGKNKFYSFYRSFLMTLFHQGLGAPDHNKELTEEIGNVPYLNGGLFEEHELEATNPKIDIDDKAFERIFDFFDQYEWHLDTRITASGKDINPDVIGYIFEKYINDRADMGAYYTKEDITDYISKNCVLPFLFDETKRALSLTKGSKAFAPDGEIWQMVKKSGDQYIYDAVKKGVEQEVPKEIAKGIKDVAARTEWNRPAPAEVALPTEIWREVIERRNRFSELKHKIDNGEILTINDFITYNLNIGQFVQDVVESTNDPDFLRAFYKALNSVTIIDPTCGSGAFLFAAMNILEPLYEACIMRMRAFVEDEDRTNKEEKKTFSHKHKFFREVLENIQSPQHPNLQYFVYKSIILRNLYGVDIMKEAVEIAKLRLFLKLVATVEADHKKPNLGLEPLPDIDFNIRAGNTLIGFTTIESLSLLPGYEPTKKKAIESAEYVSMAYKAFQKAGVENDSTLKSTKTELIKKLSELNGDLNYLLARHYGIQPENNPKRYKELIETHQPFHWFAEFYDTMINKEGFDLLIGNPPYVEYTKVTYGTDRLNTLRCGNLYCDVLEVSLSISNNRSRLGFIVPISLTSAQRMAPLQEKITSASNSMWMSNFGLRPASLFQGVMQRLTILLLEKGKGGKRYTTDYITWYSDEREILFDRLSYVLNPVRLTYSLPKVGTSVGLSALQKIVQSKRPFDDYKDIKGDNCLFYHNAGGYWVKTFDFKPYYKSLKNTEKKHTTISQICFSTAEDSVIYHGLINSNFFYFFWKSCTDARHIYPSDIAMMPFDLNKYKGDKEFYKEIKLVVKKLMQNWEENKSRIIYGQAEVDQYNIPASKSLLDQLDGLLSKHYGLNEAELDYIKNYDIKYRMGKELEEVD